MIWMWVILVVWGEILRQLPSVRQFFFFGLRASVFDKRGYLQSAGSSLDINFVHLWITRFGVFLPDCPISTFECSLMDPLSLYWQPIDLLMPINNCFTFLPSNSTFSKLEDYPDTSAIRLSPNRHHSPQTITPSLSINDEFRASKITSQGAQIAINDIQAAFN